VTIFRNLLSRLEKARESRKLKLQKEAVLTEAIERVVQSSAPVICSLRDCRRDLRSPVETALAYIDQTIALIPGPVALSPQNWDHDPLLQALFVEPDEIRVLLTVNSRLKSFFAKNPSDRAFALLTAAQHERIIFGTAVEGEIVRRDVAQTAVEFRDHRILDPAAMEVETRDALKDRALNALVAQVLERLLQLRSLKDELREQQRILSIQLKIQQTRPHNLDGLMSEDRDSDSSAPGTHPVLADIDRQIRDLSAESDSPDDYLRQLVDLLNAPQEILTVRPITLRLNWMGIKQGESSAAGHPEIQLAEVQLKERLKRVAVFVTINRTDCLKP
jgi:hypothetical protein